MSWNLLLAASMAALPSPQPSPSGIRPPRVERPTLWPGQAAPALDQDAELTLLNAARRGDLERVKTLLEQGVPANPKAGHNTPLMVASLHGHLPVMELLLSKGAKLDARDSLGRNALWAACFGDRPAAVDYLLSKGADPNARNARGDTALLLAVERGKLELARSLLDKGARVDDPTKNPIWGDQWMNPLRRAVLLRNPEMAELLIARGAKLEQADRAGRRPLMWAALDGRKELVELFLARGADRAVRDNDGKTAADLASGADVEAIRALLASPPARRP